MVLLSPSEAQAQPFNCATDQSQIATAECEALVALYTSTNGGSWTDNTGWLATGTPCTWHGVFCEDTSTGSPPKTVISLVQFNNNLTGTLPPALANLPSLVTLRLDVNTLTGPIPPAWGGFANLRILQADRNQLSGEIPISLGNLVTLDRLILSSNQLTGTVPLGVAQIGAGIEAAGDLCNLRLNASLCIPDTAPYRAIGADPICGLPLDATCTSPTFADYDIYAYNGSAATRVTFLDGTGEFNPDWAPFGPALVHDVVTFDTDGNTFVSQDLYLTAPALGSFPLTGADGGNDAAWAPFGFLIAFDRAPSAAPDGTRDETLYLVPV